MLFVVIILSYHEIGVQNTILLPLLKLKTFLKKLKTS